MSKARDLANASTALGAVTATELGYVDGVTSAIQTQIDSKIGSASAISPTIVDAKGDIIAATAADTVARLAVGANGTVLTAASGQATGLEWATVAAGSNWSLLNSGGTALTGAGTITVSGISGKDKILAIVQGASTGSTQSIFMRLNTDTGANYSVFGGTINSPSSYTENSVSQVSDTGATGVFMSKQSSNPGSGISGAFLVTGCNSAGVKQFQTVGGAENFQGGQDQKIGYNMGVYNSATVISSVSVFAAANFDGGTIYVYTSA